MKMYTETFLLQKKEKKIVVPNIKEIYSLFRQAQVQRSNALLKLVTKMPRPYNSNFLFVFFERRLLGLPVYKFKVIPFDYFQISQMQQTKINYRSMNPYYSAADFRAHKYGDRLLDPIRGLDKTDIILDKEDQFFFDQVLVNRRLKRAQRKIVQKQGRRIVRTFLKEMTLNQPNISETGKRQLPSWILERKARLKRERFIKRAWFFFKPKSEASIKTIRNEVKKFKEQSLPKPKDKKQKTGFKPTTGRFGRFSGMKSKSFQNYFLSSAIVNFVFQRYRRKWVDTIDELKPIVRKSLFLSKTFANASKFRIFTYLNSYFFPTINFKRNVLRFYRNPYHRWFSSIVKSYHPSINLFSFLVNFLKLKTSQNAIGKKRLFFYNTRPYTLFLNRFFNFFAEVLITPRFQAIMQDKKNIQNIKFVRRVRKLSYLFKRYIFFVKSFLLVSFLNVFSKQRLYLTLSNESSKPKGLNVLFNRKKIQSKIKHYSSRYYRILLRKFEKRLGRIYFNVVVKKVPPVRKFKELEVTPGQEDVDEKDYFYSRRVRAFDKADAIFYQKGVTTETKLFYAQQYLKAIPWQEAIPTIQNWNMFYFLQTAGARLLNKSVFKLYYTKAQKNKSKAIQLIKLHGQQRQALAAFFIGFLTKSGPFYTNKILPLNLHKVFLDSLKDYFSSRIHPIAVPFFFKGALRFLKRYELLRPLRIVFSSYKERRRSLQVHVLDHKNANLFTSWPGLVIKQISAVMGPTQAHKFTFLLFEKMKRAKKNFMAKILVIRHLTNFLYKYVRKHSGVFELIIKTNFKLFGNSSNMRLIDNIINTGDPNYPVRVLKRKFKRLIWARKQRFFRVNRRLNQVLNRKRYLQNKVLNKIRYLKNKIAKKRERAKAKQKWLKSKNLRFNRSVPRQVKPLSLEHLFKYRKPLFIKKYGLKRFRKMAKLQVVKAKRALLSLKKKLKNERRSKVLHETLSSLRSKFQKRASLNKKLNRKPSRELRYISAFFNYLKFLRKFVVFLLFFLLKNKKIIPLITHSFYVLCRFQHIFRFYIKYTFACFFLKRLLRKKKTEEQIRLRRHRRVGFVNHPFFKRRARRGFYAMNASYLITKVSMIRATRHGLPLKRKKSRRL